MEFAPVRLEWWSIHKTYAFLPRVRREKSWTEIWIVLRLHLHLHQHPHLYLHLHLRLHLRKRALTTKN